MSDRGRASHPAVDGDRGRIAVLAMAYGTPRTHDEILPYYTDIRRGRPPTSEQLADLVRRYDAIGGISPLAARTEAQRAALQHALDAEQPDRYLVALGLKHAAPQIEQTVAELAARGFRRIVGLVLAPHWSTYSVGQYLERMRATAEPLGMSTAGVESWATEPAFVGFVAADLSARLATMPARTRVLFTAHSLPERIVAAGDPYPQELAATAHAVSESIGLRPAGHDPAGDDADPRDDGVAADEPAWSIAWQSAGRTPEPWIGPDILTVIDALAGDGSDHGVEGILVSAVGFVADHLEVLYDLDIEAAQRAASYGVQFARTTCVNDDPTVMAALARRVIALG